MSDLVEMETSGVLTDMITLRGVAYKYGNGCTCDDCLAMAIERMNAKLRDLTRDATVRA